MAHNSYQAGSQTLFCPDDVGTHHEHVYRAYRKCLLPALLELDKLKYLAIQRRRTSPEFSVTQIQQSR